MATACRLSTNSCYANSPTCNDTSNGHYPHHCRFGSRIRRVAHTSAHEEKRPDLLRMWRLHTEKTVLRQKNMRKIWPIKIKVLLLHANPKTVPWHTSSHLHSEELKQASLSTRLNGALDEWLSQRSAKPSTAVRIRQAPLEWQEFLKRDSCFFRYTSFQIVDVHNKNGT